MLNKYKSNVQKDEFTISVYSDTVVKRKHDGNSREGNRGKQNSCLIGGNCFSSTLDVSGVLELLYYVLLCESYP